MDDKLYLPYQLSIELALTICPSTEHTTCGIFECEIGVIFGQPHAGARLLVSMHEILNRICTDGLRKFPHDKLFLVFWVESINPTVIDWYVFTEEEIQGMQNYGSNVNKTQLH